MTRWEQFKMKTLGLVLHMDGTLQHYALFGVQGSQTTTIDGHPYTTWWDFREIDWQIGDEVTFLAHYDGSIGRFVAEDIKLDQLSQKNLR